MLTRLNTFFRRLTLVAAFVTLGLGASAATAQAQSTGCQGPGCLTAETATMDLIPVAPAPVAAIATISVAPTQAMCETYPDCFSAQDVLATTSAPSPNASPVEAPGADPAKVMCETYPNCLSGMEAGDR
jgi:hypothetical protein